MADRLQWLRPSTPSQRDLQKNSFRRGAKYVLPIVAAILLGISIYWATKGAETVSVQNLEQDLSGMENTLETARFTSVDAQGRPFIVEADRVIQQNPNDMTARLDQPKGRLELNQDDALTLQARQGDYNHTQRTLFLEGDVVIRQNDDLTFTTQELNVDINAQKASNDVSVNATTKQGHILDAQAIDMSTAAGQIVFKGPARLTVHPKNSDTEQ